MCAPLPPGRSSTCAARATRTALSWWKPACCRVFRETYPYFALSRLVDRSYVKPRGYAGDYLTLQMVYDDDPGGDRRLGPYIDRWFLDIPASRAVKNRRQLIRDIILMAHANDGRPTRITSLACGPARELSDVLDDDDHPDLRATCDDIDNEALTHAQNVAHRTEANVVRLALWRETLRLRNQVLVYSVGLVDYLRDDLVVNSSTGSTTFCARVERRWSGTSMS